MRILIGADTVPTESNSSYFSSGQIDALLGRDLREIMDSADFRLVNLEVPFTSEAHPIKKSGPNLIADPLAIYGLKAMGVNCVSMANNHVLDQGPDGYYETVRVLDEACIDHFGAGSNLAEAKLPYCISAGDIKIGFVSFAEHEFTIASESTPGANPYNDEDAIRVIQSLKIECDYVVALYHGGIEHYRYPSPQLQHRCRRLVDSGADYVICQHSHCIGCYETYDNSTIVYGQGNFIFDAEELECWQTSLLIELSFTKDATSIKYYPIRKNGPFINLAQDSEGDSIIEAFESRSKEIAGDSRFLEENFIDYSRENLYWTLRSFIPGGNSIFFRVVNRITGGKLASKILGERKLLNILNKVECEAHREVLITGLKDYIGR